MAYLKSITIMVYEVLILSFKFAQFSYTFNSDKVVEKLIWFNKLVNVNLCRHETDLPDEHFEFEKERKDFYSRFFCFLVNKITYTDGVKSLKNREYIKELLKMITNPFSFADRFICLKTFLNVGVDSQRSF